MLLIFVICSRIFHPPLPPHTHTMCSSALVLLTIAIPALMITLAACIGIDGEVYPVVDKNGYYLAYKSDNTWINWWQMDKPPLATIATWWALAYVR
jgi:hypothetical protein